MYRCSELEERNFTTEVEAVNMCQWRVPFPSAYYTSLPLHVCVWSVIPPYQQRIWKAL